MVRIVIRHLVFIILLVAASFIMPVSAADITISPGDSIQTAINSAADGDTIILNAGTYSENDITITGKSLTIRSASGNRADTIIDGKSTSPRIFTVTDASSLTIEGLTLRNGQAADGANGNPGGNGRNGGAISSGGTVKIISSAILTCYSGRGGDGGDAGIGWDGGKGGNGGAIYSTGTVTVASSAIIACSAGRGGNGGDCTSIDSWGGVGGAAGDGGAIYGTTVTVTSSTITACTAGIGGNGGDCFCTGGGGQTGWYGGNGGAIYGTTVTVTSSTITACSAGRGGNGGSGYIYGGYGRYGGNGGAIHGTTVTVTSSTITGCSAGDGGNGGNENRPAGDGGNGGAVSGTAVTVTSSTITGCLPGRGGTNGIVFGSPGPSYYGDNGWGGAVYGAGTISFCRLVYNNADTAVSGTGAGIMAINNWWGSNADPASQITGTVTYEPWLVLGVDAIPASITTAQTSTIRADLTRDSDGSDTSGLGTVPDGIDAAFSTTGGTVSPSSGSTGSGAATTGFSPAATGTETITATVDGQSMSTTVDVSAAPATDPTTPPANPPASSDGGEGSNFVSPPPVAGTVNANVGGDSAVSSVTVTGTNVNDVIVTGMQPTGLPDGVPDADPNAYQYIELESARAGSITGAVISFEVPVSWLEEHGLTTSDIAMNRFVDGEWTTLPTTFDGVKNGIAYYYAESPGFSFFSIIPEKCEVQGGDGMTEEDER